MRKIINDCGECPFMHTEYDDYAVGSTTTELCVLAKYLELDYFIDVGTPEWCPLKKEEYSFKFKGDSEITSEKVIADFQEDFNKKVDEIKDKISFLEQAGTKLQNVLNELGKNTNEENQDKTDKTK
jgi:hypothetical protein